MDKKSAEKSAAEEPRATLQSPLTLTITVVTVAVVGYALMSGVGEGVIGAAAGVGVLHSLWEEEERTELTAVAARGVTGGIAGIAAAMLRSMVGERSLTGAAIVGAAVVAIAKKQLHWAIKIIKYLKDVLKLFLGVTLVAIAGTLLKWAINTIKWVKDQIKWAVSQVKEAAQWIIQAAKKAFNTLASFGASGLALTAAGVLASIALASASGLAAIGTAVAGFGGLLGLLLVLAAGAGTFGSDWKGQSNKQQTQGTDVMLPVAAILIFCFILFSCYLYGCVSLLFVVVLLPVLWFLLCYCSEKH